jgi:hypothetical protein
MPATTLALTGVQHDLLHAHLFPGDGREAAAILLCSRVPPPRLRLLVRDVVVVPHDAYRRERDAIAWPGGYIEEAIDRAEAESLSLILIHSHPGGLFAFSTADDESDQCALGSVFQALGERHGSAIMTADGAVRARVYGPDLRPHPVDLVSVAGHDLSFWWETDARLTGATRRPIAFTHGMSNELGHLSAALIGVSGTGSVVGEQLGRLGFGNVKLIDFDRVEHRNLNRILNATMTDADRRRLKVEMFAEAIEVHRGAGVAEAVAASVVTRAAVLAASQCDVLFCCVDTLEARQIADLISATFLLPLFDVGVVIPVRKSGDGVAIADVCGRLDYVQPGRSTLQDRGVYTAASLRAEYLRRAAPDAHKAEVDAGYIKGFLEEAPAVITLNMRAGSALANEFIARAYPFRLESNALYARIEFSLVACEEEFTPEGSFTVSGNPILGRGAREPLIGLPVLAPLRTGAPR